MKKYKEKYYIDCIGEDDKIHVCFPWEDTTKCGIKVKNKKPKDNDFINKYGCYECTY